jgi:hypothetical protein
MTKIIQPLHPLGLFYWKISALASEFRAGCSLSGTLCSKRSPAGRQGKQKLLRLSS